tara:strand:+ start:9582 stop:9746 length:165 start_codon:yes stop_codon:yes gene_type:complete
MCLPPTRLPLFEQMFLITNTNGKMKELNDEIKLLKAEIKQIKNELKELREKKSN